MKKQILSTVLALCLCVCAMPKTYAWQEDFSSQEVFLATESTDELVLLEDASIPANYQEVYNRMIALKTNPNYLEGTPWDDNYNPVTGKELYRWKGGKIDNVELGSGCVAFAFMLSDEAFGNLPGRKITNFKLSDVKVGDILRVEGLTHTVIVLQVTDEGVIIAEGNYNGKVHWGRSMSKADVEAAGYLITRYPKGYVPSDDPTANEPIEGGKGTFGKLAWELTKSGTLTISGNGAMPEDLDIPWEKYNDKVSKIVIKNGVTSIAASAFYKSSAVSVTIPDSVKTIDINAFRNSNIISVTIPSGVGTISDSAFRECQNLVTVNVSSGVKTIEQNAFRACRALTSITLPASIESVGAAAFFECDSMESVVFIHRNDDKEVTMGDDLFSRCYRLNTVILPKKIDKIYDRMFQNCLTLYRLNIPQGAESIGNSAFASSSLTELTIPDSVTRIGIASFSACPLKNIYFTGSQTQWDKIIKMGSETTSALQKANINYNSTGGNIETTTESSTETTTITTTESSTETTTVTTTESSTETTTVTTTESSTETTTENLFDIKFGDVDGKGDITPNDAALVLQKVLNNSWRLPIEEKNVDYMKYADVSGDKKLTATDASIILQKALNTDFVMPVELKN